MTEKSTILSVVEEYFKAYPFSLVPLAAVLALAYCWWRKPHTNFPPGARGFPVLGVLPHLGERPEETIRKWSQDKYGPVMSIRMGMKDVVVLSSFDAVMQAFLRQGSEFAGRPTSGAFQLLDMKGGGLSFKPYSSDFKHQKKFVLKKFREFGVGRQPVDEMANEEADAYCEFLRNKGTHLMDIKDDLYTLTTNVISRLVCGQRYEFDDPAMKELLYALRHMFADPKVGIVDMFPITKWLPHFRQAVKDFIKHEYHVYHLARKQWDQHKAAFDPNNLTDFMDLYRYEQEFGSGEGHKGFTDHQAAWLGADFFVAASETTSSQLGWCFHLYLYFPEYQKALDEEILKVFGTSGRVTQEHKARTPFLNAFIQETLRFRAVAPLVLKHLAIKSTKLMGYDIPAGTSVIPNFHAVHMDPLLWSDPDKFDPYRHIDEQGNFVFSNKIIPFSIGLRSCPGELLARVEIYVFFARILQKFKVMPGDEPPHIDCVSAVVTYAKPYKFRVVERYRA